MKPSFVVNTILNKNGQRQEKTIPCVDYEDAATTAAALNRGSRRAEVCVSVLLHDRSVLLPFKFLPDIQDAIAIILEEETRPTAIAKPKLPPSFGSTGKY